MLDSDYDLFSNLLTFCQPHFKTIKYLEGSYVTFVDVLSIMDNLKSVLLQRQNDKYFNNTTKQK